MGSGDYTIRPLREDEAFLLEEFNYQAIFQSPGQPHIGREVMDEPRLRLYVDDFGSSPHDHCLVAEFEGKVVGAVWSRILADPDLPGYGNVDEQTPEFALSLLPEHRGNGVGTQLMKQMLARLKDAGYRKASLSAHKDNYAVRMYQKLGFSVIKDQGEDHLMMINLFDSRIRLRQPVEEDRGFVYEKWASDSDVTRFMAWATHTKRSDADALITMSNAMWEQYGCGPLIIELNDTGEIIGSAGLLFDGSETVGVGYVLRKEFQGKGYASEALAQSVAVARIMGVKRVQAGIHPANIASRNVAKKGGFTVDAENPSSSMLFPQIDPEHEGCTVNYVLDLESDEGVEQA